MPRFTVIIDEECYKYNPQRFENDPGAFRSPVDLCNACAKKIDPKKVARILGMGRSSDWVREQLERGIAEKEGHWPDDCHPSYGETDCCCAQCGIQLLEEDN